jgi:hypothetical protein
MEVSRSNQIGGYIGGLVGCCGWVLGLGIACLWTGDTRLAKPLLPGLAVSLALGLALVVAHAAVERVSPRHSTTTLWGMVLLLLALLCLLINHWIEPMIRDSIAEHPFLLSDFWWFSDRWATVTLAVAVILLGSVAKSILFPQQNEAKPS